MSEDDELEEEEDELLEEDESEDEEESLDELPDSVLLRRFCKIFNNKYTRQSYLNNIINCSLHIIG